jgi:hypothetical protein
MHMVPATGDIDRQLKSVKTGQMVRFKGYLIEVQGADGWRWRSSLTRDDAGNHACELVWVEEFEVLET